MPMSRMQTVEGMAATLALVLLLFAPMLDPLVSLILAIAMIVVLLAILGLRGRMGTPQR